ncbi:SNF1-related protein kinase regulatory subunit gamma-1-like [Euphorbia lathyris]|uniref:SNF1-related protein kinase regulatory subunit gamma-1-like n=1 Tax=Euphorbia lathyris TaxID=212925 RepID=UPI00331366F9
MCEDGELCQSANEFDYDGGDRVYDDELEDVERNQDEEESISVEWSQDEDTYGGGGDGNEHNVYLMTRVLMSSEEEHSQRHRLFRTRCLVLGRKCEMESKVENGKSKVESEEVKPMSKDDKHMPFNEPPRGLSKGLPPLRKLSHDIAWDPRDSAPSPTHGELSSKKEEEVYMLKSWLCVLRENLSYDEPMRGDFIVKNRRWKGVKTYGILAKLVKGQALFHVLLLLSKHPRLEMVPVIHNKSDSKVIGFITQNDVTQLLLRSSGLEWFDGIANKALSEFCFEGQEHMNICVYGDQSLAEGLGVLWESRIGAVAIVNRGNEKIMGCITSNHVLLIFQDNKLFNMRKNLSMKEFIDMEAPKKDSHGLITPQVYSLVTATTSDTLKHAMNQLVKSKANVCFLIDDLKKVMGMVTLRDIIVQFAPPCIDSGFHGGGFFDSALEQTGCQLKNETIICDH